MTRNSGPTTLPHMPVPAAAGVQARNHPLRPIWLVALFPPGGITAD